MSISWKLAYVIFYFIFYYQDTRLCLTSCLWLALVTNFIVNFQSITEKCLHARRKCWELVKRSMSCKVTRSQNVRHKAVSEGRYTLCCKRPSSHRLLRYPLSCLTLASCSSSYSSFSYSSSSLCSFCSDRILHTHTVLFMLQKHGCNCLLFEIHCKHS